MFVDSEPSVGLGNVLPQHGAQIAVDAINAVGGIKGHPLELKVCSTPFDPNIAEQCARQYASNPDFVAVVGNVDNEAPAANPVLLNAHIPVIGNYPVTPPDYTAANSFPLNGGGGTVYAASVDMLVDLDHRTKIGAATLDVPGGSLSTEYLLPSLAARHLSLAADIALNPAQQDYSPEAAKAISSTDAMVLISDPTTAARFAIAIAQQSSAVKMATAATALDSSFIKALGGAGQGMYLPTFFPPDNLPVQGNEMYLSEAKRYGSPADELNEQSKNAWLAVQVFRQAATQVTGPITGAAVMAELQTMTDINTYGLTPPIDFSRPGTVLGGAIPRVVNTSVVYAELKNGSLVALDRGQFHAAYGKAPS
jgi:ABC-type branched-subunit amino acid transport system substrate-binding protein